MPDYAFWAVLIGSALAGLGFGSWLYQWLRCRYVSSLSAMGFAYAAIYDTRAVEDDRLIRRHARQMKEGDGLMATARLAERRFGRTSVTVTERKRLLQ